MELENVFLQEQIRKLRDKLQKAEAQELKLRERVSHLLSYAYSDKCSEKDAIVRKKEEEIKRLERVLRQSELQNSQLRKHIDFLYKKSQRLDIVGSATGKVDSQLRL